jgi:hypothetical protein
MAISIEVKVKLVTAIRKTPSNGRLASTAATGEVLWLISLFTRDLCSMICLHRSFGTSKGTENTLLIGGLHCPFSVSFRHKGKSPVVAARDLATPCIWHPTVYPSISLPMPSSRITSNSDGSAVNLIYDLSFRIYHRQGR